MAAQDGRTTQEAVRDVVGPAVEETGLYLEDVVVTRAGDRSVVRVTVDLTDDKVGSLDSDALGDASRAVSAALDERDVVPGAYVLEVSTPGTSRPLTQVRHFRRARTRMVSLKLQDGSTVAGRLVDVIDGADGTDGGPVLALEDGTRVAVADVRRGKIEVELKRADEVLDEQDDTNDSTGPARHEKG